MISGSELVNSGGITPLKSGAKWQVPQRAFPMNSVKPFALASGEGRAVAARRAIEARVESAERAQIRGERNAHGATCERRVGAMRERTRATRREAPCRERDAQRRDPPSCPSRWGWRGRRRSDPRARARARRRSRAAGTRLRAAWVCCGRATRCSERGTRHARSASALFAASVARGTRVVVSSIGRARPSVNARCGWWHVAHERSSAPERRVSLNSRAPSAMRAGDGAGA